MTEQTGQLPQARNSNFSGVSLQSFVCAQLWPESALCFTFIACLNQHAHVKEIPAEGQHNSAFHTTLPGKLDWNRFTPSFVTHELELSVRAPGITP